MEAEILEFIVEVAVEELFAAILTTKCCKRSQKKWKKIRERWRRDPDRTDRLREIVASSPTTSPSPTLRSTMI
jgi:hypothetical protein